MSCSATVPSGNAYDKYGSTHSIERRLVTRFLSKLDSCLDGTSPSRILEVGVGEGAVAARVLERFPNAPVVGVDLPSVQLAESWSSLRLTGCCADIASLPFLTGSFDLVLAIEVLEHVPDPDAALAEISRVAVGDIVVSVPREPVWRAANIARGKYVRDLGNTPGHIQHWSRSGIVHLVQRHFEVTSVHKPFPWTLIKARGGQN